MPDDPPDPAAGPPPAPKPEIFRITRTAYLILPFLAAGVWPFALYGGDGSGSTEFFGTQDGASYARPAQLTPLVLLFLIPVLAIVFIARTATIIDAEGVQVRAVLGSRRLPWSAVRGLSIRKRSVYAVLADGSVRLPCVGVQQLSRVAAASGGRLPKIAPPTPKYAPQRRRRR